MKKKQKARKPPTVSRQTTSFAASTISTGSPSKWTRIERAITLPSYVKEALQRLDDAGHLAYVVGGSVRDFLIGREPKDHDIATSAQPDELAQLFPEAIEVGKAFGVLKIPIQGMYEVLEIATFRQDLEYKDYRRPTGVLFAGPVEDAQRRDFTINGLYYDPKTARILDCVGGMADIKAKVVRAIGNPLDRFREDALRLMRAIRITTTLGFSLDPNTSSAIKARARLITKISSERVRDELNLALCGSGPADALELMMKHDLLLHVLPEVDALRIAQQIGGYLGEPNAWKHTLRVLRSLARVQKKDRSPTLMWAALLAGVGKPVAAKKNGGKNFNGHELEGARLAKIIGERLRLPKQEIDWISSFVGQLPKFREVFEMREATLQRFIRQPGFSLLLELHRADATALDGNLAYYEFCEVRLKELKATNEPRLLSGEDLIQLGFNPGPRFSEILRTVEDLAYEHRLKTKEEALEYVVKHYVE